MFILGAAELPSDGSRSLANAAIPMVSLLVDRSAAGVPSVITNDRDAMRDGTLHLIALGHRSFLYIAGPTNHYHEVERFRGVLDALAVAGLSERAVIRYGGERGMAQGFQGGIEAAQMYLALKRRPTAVISCVGDSAISFIGTVRSGGVSVPGDVSVIGFDGAAIGEFCAAPLTSLEQPTEGLGVCAARIMLSLLDGSAAAAPLRTMLPSRLVLRDSTSVPKRPHRQSSGQS